MNAASQPSELLIGSFPGVLRASTPLTELDAMRGAESGTTDMAHRPDPLQPWTRSRARSRRVVGKASSFWWQKKANPRSGSTRTRVSFDGSANFLGPAHWAGNT